MDNQQLRKILNSNNEKYNNHPQLIKELIKYKGDEGHKKIHKELLKELIDKYVKLTKELEEKIAEVTKLSETDQLTKIYNRVKFVNELEKEINRSERYQTKLSLIMFDIDHFKAVNDKYGHDIGDETLIKLTEVVSKTVRDTDVFARWGGEEFMVLAPQTGLEEAIRLAERIRKNIAEKEIKQVGHVTCSFGVTEFKATDDFDKFTKRVDEALYQAKENGRNQVISK